MSRLRLRWLWNRLLYTLWFLPLLLIAASALLAAGLVEASEGINTEILQRWPRVFGASAGSSRDMLAAIAGSMITVAGVTFSITMVAVTQASTQYTSRILRNFMRDRPSQLVLGGLSGVFTYCLIVLRTIRGDEANPYVPSIAVLAAFALAVVGVGLMIYFVHHIATALQASTIIARVSADTIEAIDSLFPADAGRPAPEPVRLPASATARSWTAVQAPASGYVQNVDPGALLVAARHHGLVIRMERGIGEFVAMGTPLASVVRIDGGPVGDPPAGIVRSFSLGTFRTVEQDPAFGIRQLVDIALKALSPGINDPTTALTCIDYLGAALVRAAARQDAPPWHADDGEVRVLTRPATFAGLLDDAFDEIRRYGEGHPPILTRQLDMLEVIGRAVRTPDRRRHVQSHVELIAEAADRSIRAPSDRRALQVRAADARAALAAQ